MLSRERNQRFMEMLGFLSSGALYITSSAGMMAFNKYLISQSRFPYVVFLVFTHSGVGFVMALILRVLKPSLFPSLTSSSGQAPLNGISVATVIFIAVLFAGQLVLMNQAFLHSSMTFMQMLKEFNVVMVYGMSLLAGLEIFTWIKMSVILSITFATLMTIRGEMHFSLAGFAFQGTGQVVESLKIVLQVLLLTRSYGKIDPLSYILLFIPFCFLFLGAFLIFSYHVEPAFGLKTPSWSEVVGWWPLLLANSCLAFLLNVSAAVFMTYGSAVAFVLAGVIKDVVIVMSGAALMGEHVSAVQFPAFFSQVALVWLWSMMSRFPENFKDGFLRGILSLPLFSSTRQTDETTRLQTCSSRHSGP